MIEIHNGALVHAYVIEGTLYYARIHMGPFVTTKPREWMLFHNTINFVTGV